MFSRPFGVWVGAGVSVVGASSTPGSANAGVRLLWLMISMFECGIAPSKGPVSNDGWGPSREP
jgi:hypothetical protein